MYDDALMFSVGQAITVSARSNWPGTGFGSFAAGILDTGGAGSLDAVGKWPLTISTGQMFTGPVGATLQIYLQDSPDGVTWSNTPLGTPVALTLATLGAPGVILLKSVFPIYGGTNPPVVLDRYLSIFYTVAGGPFTAGTLNAGFVPY